MPVVAYPHIVTDEHGVLRVDGAWYKVIVLLQRIVAQEMSVDEILESWPLMTVAQAHALLAYYYDNKAELDEELRERQRSVEEFFARPEIAAQQERIQARVEEWKRNYP